MRFRLRYLQHDFELTEGEFAVGRNASCQLSLDDPLVSRRHALLRVSPTGVSVEDLQSRNGVLVNGQRIEGTVALAAGDRILIGSQEMTLLALDDQPGRARLNLTLPKITPATPVAPPAPSSPNLAAHAAALGRTPLPSPGPPGELEGTRPTPAAANIIAKIHGSTTEPGGRTLPEDRASSPGLPMPQPGRIGSSPGTPMRAVATPGSGRVLEANPLSAPRTPVSGGAGILGPQSRHPPPLPLGGGSGATPEPEYELTMIRRADAFTLLTGVAEKALAMGRAVEAERILASPLGDVIEASRAGKKIIPSLVDQAARFSAKLATATGKGAWADYVIELYSAQRRPCPAPVIDELYNALRRVTAIDLQRLREYIEELRTRLSTFGPAERFLFQRLEGLERLAALR
ncbi:FHA domain-containing protein [Pendulispora rubella]|uniref:FHA domain-containing protein n=1 Tax=Pendulispora rubella TaxID=2741070 RepID=A0ABZ2LHL7_9BACT